MNGLMRAALWGLATVAVAAAVHIGSVHALPHLIMGGAMHVIEGRVGINHMAFAGRPNAASRGVVRPSPDLLYSTCVFDLSHGPVRVRASAMPDTYWSVSLFDADTNNFYVLNDRQAKTGGVDFTIVPPSQDKQPFGNVVRSPTVRGLVLFRTLIDDEAKLKEIDAARRHASCAPFQAG
ncbi:MAG TPA: DUF1254 domain-containing protein [Rhizomicrobium sp.]|jgi:uncharacterized membrane protein|nr:DUF1254 domain-containing protein [Rhizomicrobium sp.]